MGVGVQTKDRMGPWRHTDQAQGSLQVIWNSARGRKDCKGFPMQGSFKCVQAGGRARGDELEGWKGDKLGAAEGPGGLL